jgi:outer membrane protein
MFDAPKSLRANHSRTMLLLLALVAALSVAAPCQQPPKPLSLPEVVARVLAKYPSLRVSREREVASQAAVDLARTAYLPSLNALWQGNRATRNNIFGQLLPQSIIPPISGPVLPTTSGQGATGSAAGALLSWEVFDFGYRSAGVTAARAAQNISGAEVKIARLDLGLAAANAFINLVAAQELTRAAQSNVDRRQVFDKAVHVLVDNELRPGAEASRADAELAAARITLIQSQTSERVARVALATLLGVPPESIAVDSATLLQSPPSASAPETQIQFHPLALAQNARVGLADSQIAVLDRGYLPHIFFQGSLSGRGSGANNDGSFGSFSDGLTLQRRNWAAGVTATFAAGDWFSLRARKRGAEANRRVEAARYEQTLDDLNGQAAQAQAALDGARQVAENTPFELKAAQDGERQARARYDAALTTVVEVAEAQNVLIRAEIDDALARLNVWKSMAAVAAAQGDLNPFITAAGGH